MSVRLSNQQQQQQPKRRIAVSKLYIVNVLTVPFALTQKHTIFIHWLQQPKQKAAHAK
jgi:hypothetical protein